MLTHRIAGVVSLTCFTFSSLFGQTDNTPSQQIVPIPGPQAYSEPHSVDAIVTDAQGNLHEQSYTYHPNYYKKDSDHPDPNVVIINNTQQVTTAPDGYDGSAIYPSIFFPLFSIGFIFASGYWCGYNGFFWNGRRYSRVRYNNWHSHWNNYWNRDWNHRWGNHWNSRQGNHNWQYHQNRSWSDHTGREWRNSGGHAGGHGGGGHR